MGSADRSGRKGLHFRQAVTEPVDGSVFLSPVLFIRDRRRSGAATGAAAAVATGRRRRSSSIYSRPPRQSRGHSRDPRCGRVSRPPGRSRLWALQADAHRCFQQPRVPFCAARGAALLLPVEIAGSGATSLRRMEVAQYCSQESTGRWSCSSTIFISSTSVDPAQRSSMGHHCCLADSCADDPTADLAVVTGSVRRVVGDLIGPRSTRCCTSSRGPGRAPTETASQ